MGAPLALYDQLLVLTPTAIVALNRAVAVAEVDGPAKALALVDALDLAEFYLFHAIRADLLTRLGRVAEAIRAYDSATALATNSGSRELLQRRRRALAS